MTKYIEKIEVKANPLLDDNLQNQKPLKLDDVIEGSVLAVEKSAVYVNVFPHGTGVIYGYEFIQAKDVIKKLNIGDTVTAKVVDLENEKGYIELSLKEAKAALVWADAEEAMKNKTIMSKKRHQVRYCLQVKEFEDSMEAAHNVGECLHHRAECEGIELSQSSKHVVPKKGQNGD
jgi:ribosomal protein S1